MKKKKKNFLARWHPFNHSYCTSWGLILQALKISLFGKKVNCLNFLRMTGFTVLDSTFRLVCWSIGLCLVQTELPVVSLDRLHEIEVLKNLWSVLTRWVEFNNIAVLDRLSEQGENMSCLEQAVVLLMNKREDALTIQHVWKRIGA